MGVGDSEKVGKCQGWDDISTQGIRVAGMGIGCGVSMCKHGGPEERLVGGLEGH